MLVHVDVLRLRDTSFPTGLRMTYDVIIRRWARVRLPVMVIPLDLSACHRADRTWYDGELGRMLVTKRTPHCAYNLSGSSHKEWGWKA